jgi:hypothetical protein
VKRIYGHYLSEIHWRIGLMFRRFRLILGLILVAFVTACNSNSDAISILQSDNTSLRATLDSYKNLSATVTAEATTMAQKLATTQAELNLVRAQNSELVATLNTGSNGFNSSGSQGDSSDPMASTGSGNTGNNAPSTSGQDTSDSTAFSLAQVVTTKDQDSNGCAVGQSNVFSVNDAEIWVIADVRNYKNGTEFTAKWSGENFNHEDSWTISQNGEQICVHFYIEPSTLEMAPGGYTVTMTAGTLSSPPIQFTLEGQASQ